MYVQRTFLNLFVFISNRIALAWIYKNKETDDLKERVNQTTYNIFMYTAHNISVTDKK